MADIKYTELVKSAGKDDLARSISKVIVGRTDDAAKHLDDIEDVYKKTPDNTYSKKKQKPKSTKITSDYVRKADTPKAKLEKKYNVTPDTAPKTPEGRYNPFGTEATKAVEGGKKELDSAVKKTAPKTDYRELDAVEKATKTTKDALKKSVDRTVEHAKNTDFGKAKKTLPYIGGASLLVLAEEGIRRNMATKENKELSEDVFFQADKLRLSDIPMLSDPYYQGTRNAREAKAWVLSSPDDKEARRRLAELAEADEFMRKLPQDKLVDTYLAYKDPKRSMPVSYRMALNFYTMQPKQYVDSADIDVPLVPRPYIRDIMLGKGMNLTQDDYTDDELENQVAEIAERDKAEAKEIAKNIRSGKYDASGDEPIGYYESGRGKPTYGSVLDLVRSKPDTLMEKLDIEPTGSTMPEHMSTKLDYRDALRVAERRRKEQEENKGKFSPARPVGIEPEIKAETAEVESSNVPSTQKEQDGVHTYPSGWVSDDIAERNYRINEQKGAIEATKKSLEGLSDKDLRTAYEKADSDTMAAVKSKNTLAYTKAMDKQRAVEDFIRNQGKEYLLDPHYEYKTKPKTQRPVLKKYPKSGIQATDILVASGVGTGAGLAAYGMAGFIPQIHKRKLLRALIGLAFGAGAGLGTYHLITKNSK